MGAAHMVPDMDVGLVLTVAAVSTNRFATEDATPVATRASS